MRAYRATALLLLLVASAVGAADPGAIRVPTPPQPEKQPAPPPDAVLKLKKGQFYVVASQSPLVVDAVGGAGAVSVAERKGPLMLPAELAVGYAPDAADPEFVTFTEPYLYVVKAGGTDGNAYLQIIPALNAVDKDGKQVPLKRADIIRRTVDVSNGGGPIPPPSPKPDPKPQPDPVDPAADPVLVKKFADAVAKDGANKAHVAALAKIYASAAAILEGGDPAAKPTTYGGLVEVMTSSSIAAGVPRLPALANLRAEVNAALPEADAKAALAGDLLTNTVAGYKRVGAALSAAAK